VLWDSIVDLKDAINLQDLGLAINTAGMLPFAPGGARMEFAPVVSRVLQSEVRRSSCSSAVPWVRAHR
jgi:hypothetical protein